VLELLFKNMSEYTIDHHERLIADIYPTAVELELQAMPEYFDNRIQSLNYLNTQKLTYGCLK
jgi:hypothetical protein